MGMIKMVTGVVLVCMVVGIASAQDAKPADKDAAAVKEQTLCPVMGGAINTNLFADVEGKRIYVCCKGCIAPIKKDPAKFIKKLEDEGVTLDKTPEGDKSKEAKSEEAKK